MQNSIKILCTRPLDKGLKDEAELSGIEIRELSFIITEPLQSIDVQQEIELVYQQNATVVFTSMNAVEAVAFYQEDNQPEWDIYCIGTTTNKLAVKYFGAEKVAGTADDATSLAELIAEEGRCDEVVFFCGDQRRDELPDILRNSDIDVNEITVYQTIAVPHKVQEDYHGILFFSPSAVRSFFGHNKVPPATILFAIGNTTAMEIRKHTGNKIIIGDEPGKAALVKKVVEYFT